MELITASHPDEPALDMALTHALLRGVAAGDLPELARVFRPGPTVAFGRLDTLRAGYDEARAAAVTRGRVPVRRLGGGHAAAYDADAVVLELITRPVAIVEGTHERFAAGITLVADALATLGVATEVGELPGEYCPGRWSLHLPDGPKVAGAAQRSIRGASLFTAIVVVGGAAGLRELLVAVYAALGLVWSPSTAGAVDDVHSGTGAGAVLVAVVDELRRTRELGDGAISEATVTAARALLEQHA